MVRLCTIGAGKHAGKNVYPCFSLLKNAEVVANADLNVELARERARMFGLRASYENYWEMLDKEKPDGVIICVGPEFHSTAAKELMKAGFHVYTEKPPAVDATNALEVLKVAEQTGMICMTGFKKRFAPCYLKMKRLIQDERFGAPACLSIFRTSGNYGNRANPRSQYILDSGIHVVDLAIYLFGNIAAVSAAKKQPANYAITLHFACGAVGSLTLTDRMSYARGWENVTVVGDAGMCIQADNSVEMTAYLKDTPVAAHKPDFVSGSTTSAVELGFVGELQEFVDAVNGQRAAESSIKNAYHVMQAIDAIVRAADTGERVHIDIRKE